MHGDLHRDSLPEQPVVRIISENLQGFYSSHSCCRPYGTRRMDQNETDWRVEEGIAQPSQASGHLPDAGRLIPPSNYGYPLTKIFY